MNLAGALCLVAAVPVGWLAAKAASRLAEARVPVAVMIGVEAGVALACVLLAPPGAWLALLAAGWTLGMLAAVDVLALRLPDLVTAPLGLAGLILGPPLLHAPLLDHLIGAAAGYAALAGIGFAYERLRGRDGLGLGDAKLLAVAGAWLGWRALPGVVLIACAGGIAWAAVRLIRRGRAGLAEPIAFGAPLCAALWVVLLSTAAGLVPGP